uniref:Uncharacterized protein n=1 Tax=Myotis lucifugus TaxID=59463 RepID=G1QGH2_MYOLU
NCMSWADHWEADHTHRYPHYTSRNPYKGVGTGSRQGSGDVNYKVNA